MATWTDTSSGTSTTSAIWATWVDSTSTSATTETIWVQWSSGTSGNGSVTYADDSYSAPPETEEQQQARLERQRQRQEELEVARLQREAAARKAKELLREILDAKQREQFDKTEWFFVIGQSGKRYRVRHGWAGNIDEVTEDDMVVASYCIHPQSRVPIEDSMLVQKLMLETDEDRFVKIANKTTLGTPRALAV